MDTGKRRMNPDTTTIIIPMKESLQNTGIEPATSYPEVLYSADGDSLKG